MGEIKLDRVAITGLSLKLPNSNSFRQFWDNLTNGIDCISEFPLKRRQESEMFSYILDNDKQKACYALGGYLDDISGFDCSFFNINKCEADQWNPHIRIMVEVIYHALEDGGYKLDELRKKKVGIYIGFFEENNLYDELAYKNSYSFEIRSSNSYALSCRIAEIFNFNGPALDIDTACSSSLVAVHTACNELRTGICDIAIVGGISLAMLPFVDSGLSINSSQGKTMTFDERSDGTSTGEGCAALILRKHEDAKTDRDAIYAIIEGSCVNQDGKTIGMAAPSMTSQERVITQAWMNAGINPEQIIHIEMHGTGTKLGDPTECGALKKAFQRFTNKKQICAIGSIKSNIGHLDACSGMAGLLKTIGIIYFKGIPPTLHFQFPNSRIDFINAPFYVNTQYDTLASVSGRYCGVNSFGVSGTNCHMILGSCDTEKCRANNDTNSYIITLSAKTLNSLMGLVKAYINWNFNDGDSIADVCYTANSCRSAFPYRIAMIIKNINDLKCKLNDILLEKSYYIDIYFSNQFRNKKTIGNNEICCAFVNGENINWNEFYGKKRYNKVHLPTYCFFHKKIWPGAHFENLVSRDKINFHYIKWKQRGLECNKLDFGIIVVVGDGSTQCNLMIDEMRARGIVVAESTVSTIAQTIADTLNIANAPQGNILIVQHISAKPVSSPYDLTCNLNNGLFKVFKLLKTLEFNRKIELVIIFNYANKIANTDNVIPENGSIMGLSKVACMEIPKFKCRCIDTDYYTSSSILVDEILASTREFIVGYRNNIRYVERISELRALYNTRSCVLNDQNIIIVGGTGGIGSVICKHLLSTRRNIKIIVISRSEKDENLHDSSIYHYSADISNQIQMHSVTSAIKQRFGKVHCIINCATSLNDQPISEITLDEYKKLISTKIYGTYFLGEMASCLCSEHMILFSSVITLIGSVNSSAYASANAYMDAFSYSHQSYRVHTLNWCSWDQIGMSRNTSDIEGEKLIFLPLKREIAVKSFEIALATQMHRIIIGEYNESIISDLMTSMPFTLEKHENNELETLPISNTDIDCQSIINIISETLGFVEIKNEENFFDIGGDSIFALKIINSISKKYGVKIDISVFFEKYTIGDLSEYIVNLIYKEHSRLPPIKHIQDMEYYPVSSSQSRMVVLSILTSQEPTTYTLTETVKIHGNLDVEKLIFAFNKVVERHEIFRTTFHIINDRIVQKVHNDLHVEVEIVDDDYVFSNLSFDLSKLPLFNVKLIQLDSYEYILSYTLHSIILDGKSRGILIYEIAKIYTDDALPPLNIQYRDYAFWQQRIIEEGHLKKQEEFWLSQYSEKVPTLNCLYDMPRTLETGYKGGYVSIALNDNVYAKLKELAQKCSTTLFTIMISGFILLLYKNTRNTDYVIGTLVEGRFDKEIENLIGMFLNTLAIRFTIQPNESLYDLIEYVKNRLIQAYDNQEYPFDMLIDKLNVKRTSGRNPLFDFMFVMHHNYPFDYKLEYQELIFEPYNSTENEYPARFDLTLDIMEHNDKCMVNIYYNISLFKYDTARRLLNEYIEIINCLIDETKSNALDIIHTEKDVIGDKGLYFDFDFDL